MPCRQLAVFMSVILLLRTTNTSLTTCTDNCALSSGTLKQPESLLVWVRQLNATSSLAAWTRFAEENNEVHMVCVCVQPSDSRASSQGLQLAFLLGRLWRETPQEVRPARILLYAERELAQMLPHAADASQDIPISSIVMVDSRVTPMASFFSHSNFETGNGETSYKAQRANNKIVCSSYLSQVDLHFNDLVLSYLPVETTAAIARHQQFDYLLSRVATTDGRCFTAQDFQNRDFSRDVSPLANETVMVSRGGLPLPWEIVAQMHDFRMPPDTDLDFPFPRCLNFSGPPSPQSFSHSSYSSSYDYPKSEQTDIDTDLKLRSKIESLLDSGVRVVLLASSSQIVCNFYISMAEIGAMRWRTAQPATWAERFSRGTLEEFSGDTDGLVQDSLELDVLLWTRSDRYGSSLKSVQNNSFDTQMVRSGGLVWLNVEPTHSLAINGVVPNQLSRMATTALWGLAVAGTQEMIEQRDDVIEL